MLFFYAIGLIIDDYMQKMVDKKPFVESLDDPQEEGTSSLINKDEIGVQVCKKIKIEGSHPCKER